MIGYERTIWIIGHQEAKYALQRSVDSGFIPSLIITLNDEIGQRRSGFYNGEDVALALGIEIYSTLNVNSISCINKVRSVEPNLIVCLGWGQILKKDILSAAHFVVGAHASLLPFNRGSAPINWSIINGEEVTGNTLMLLDETLDGGGIIDQESFDVHHHDTCNTLYEKVALTNANMVTKFLASTASEIQVTRQCLDEGSHNDRRRPDDGAIDWGKSSTDIYNLVRALVPPYPPAFFFHNGEKFHVVECGMISDDDIGVDAIAGSILSFEYSFRLYNVSMMVKCGTGVLNISKLLDDADSPIFGEEILKRFKKNEHLQ